MFDDKGMRKKDDISYQISEYIKNSNEDTKNLRKNRIVLNQKELEAQKILKVINGI